MLQTFSSQLLELAFSDKERNTKDKKRVKIAKGKVKYHAVTVFI